jgi:hypothetical protein
MIKGNEKILSQYEDLVWENDFAQGVANKNVISCKKSPEFKLTSAFGRRMMIANILWTMRTVNHKHLPPPGMTTSLDFA